MSSNAEDIFQKIMESAVKSSEPGSPNNLPKFHVSQTADQLPDIRKRNAYYRAELEKQIQDKREAERKRKEREVLEEERLLRKIEADREKLKLEYFEEIRQRELMQEDAIRKQQIIARKLEEIQEAEERKRDEELKRRQQAAAKRMAELEEAMERKRLEELEKRKQAALERFYYWDAPIVKADYYRSGWNSREYVNSALGIEGAGVGGLVGGAAVIAGAGGRRNENYSMNVNLASSLDDLYYTAPLSTLAEVYRRLVYEKSRIKEVIKERISEGES